jgi:HPt (histidine-containing phosphotransfer) domain-containing protein
MQTGPAATLRLAKLLELFGGDRDAVSTLLSAAAGSIKADFARIESGVAAHDFGAVAQAAQRLRGTAGSIRSPLLGELGEALERAASTATSAIPEALVAELRAAVDSLLADVEKHSRALAKIG